MLSRTFLFCFYLVAVSHVKAANILWIFPVNIPPGNIIHMTMIKGLADDGHNITVVTLLPLEDKHPNWQHIHLPQTPEDAQLIEDVVDKFSKPRTNLWETFKTLDLLNEVQLKSLKNLAFQELLSNKDNHFDLVIQGFALHNFIQGIAVNFKCPAIISWTYFPFGRVKDITGNPHGISYIPLPWVGMEPMGFWGRVSNFVIRWLSGILTFLSNLTFEGYYNSKHSVDIRPLKRMPRNMSVVFCSNFFSEKPDGPYGPNVIEIGCVQENEKEDPLAKDIEDFIQTADDGVMFFNSISKVHVRRTNVIYSVLVDKTEKTFCKWEYTGDSGKASNIRYKQWLPEDEIPFQLFTKLRGGVDSIIKPQLIMLSLPFSGNQLPKENTMEHHGYGLIVDVSTMTEEEFKNQLEKVLSNSISLKAVKQYAAPYRDRQMSSQKSFVNWSEYVVRQHGAKHMQGHWNVCRYTYLDLGLLIVVGIAVLLILKIGVCWTRRLLRNLGKGCITKEKIK